MEELGEALKELKVIATPQEKQYPFLGSLCGLSTHSQASAPS